MRSRYEFSFLPQPPFSSFSFCVRSFPSLRFLWLRLVWPLTGNGVAELFSRGKHYQRRMMFVRWFRGKFSDFGCDRTRDCLDEMVYGNSKEETKLRVDVGIGLTASELFLSNAAAKSKWSDLTWSYRCSSIYKLYSLLRSELSNCYLNTQSLILLIEIPETPCLIKLVISTSLFILPAQLPAT